jgi:hypothetical protein
MRKAAPTGFDEYFDRLEPGMRRAITAALSAPAADVAEFTRLLKEGNIGEALRSIGVTFTEADIKAIQQEMQRAFRAGALLAAAQLRAEEYVAGIGFTGLEVERLLPSGATVNEFTGGLFDVVDRHAARWAEEHAATLISDIADESKRAIAGLVERATLGEFTVSELADAIEIELVEQMPRLIERSVGLHGRYVDAVWNYHQGLVQGGLKDGLSPAQAVKRADRMADTYARRLRQKRAQTIARTELNNAMQAGKMDGWKEAENANILQPGRTKRVWVVTTDDRLCSECAPMEGQVVGWGDPFVSSEIATSQVVVRQGYEDRVTLGDTKPRQYREDPKLPKHIKQRKDGALTLERPYLHPNCRCDIALEFDLD